MVITNGMPPQQLSFKQKGKAWRKKCVDFADSKTLFNYSPVRNSVIHKKINYDLLQGKLHMSDLEAFINPDKIKASYISDSIVHYPIMNSKLNVLRGEESKRAFDFRVVVTNPNAISEIEDHKNAELAARVQQLIASQSSSEEEFTQKLQEVSDYFTYEWQDQREVRANALLTHYIKEYNMPLLFNAGFMDALAVGEEIYQCDIVGGEPVIEKLNPMKVRVFRSGYSNRIEDADMIILEDYWSPGRIIDTYGEVLTSKDLKYIEELPYNNGAVTADEMGNIDERQGFINTLMLDDTFESAKLISEFTGVDASVADDCLPYDAEGNVRVMRVYWKSRRKIKKVTFYDPETGEKDFTFQPENYVLNKDLGEEETCFWINEAWEGTKIGEEIYVNMRPRPIQYWRLSNPSRCHFGIIGSIYNLNEGKPFSMVDMMKEYNYSYDVIHDRLNKLMAKNWGKLVKLDLAKVPSGWKIDKWMYYAKVNNLVIEDGFREGNQGAATGKLAGGLNNASSGVVDAELGNSIQFMMNMLEWIKGEMGEVAGISKQREGQISNRETVGGVERATLQSSHITEWLFTVHDDVKKRALECFLETAKISLKGRNKKFQYLLADSSQQIATISGDEFAEADYGLVVDNSTGVQELNQKLDVLAQAALQNSTISFSTVMKLYNSSSLAEKQRLVERDERRLQQRQQEAQQQEIQVQQQQLEAQAAIENQKMQFQDALNQRDNETKILVASINQANQGVDDGIEDTAQSQQARDKLLEQMREFDQKMKLDKERLNFDKQKAKTDADIKKMAIKQKSKK